MTHLALRWTAIALAAPALALSAVGTASAQETDTVVLGSGTPADLQVGLTGPVTGAVGGSGTFVLTVRNTGETPAPGLAVTEDLPAGVAVVGVEGTSTWTCVLAPLRCTLPSGLAPGAAAEPLRVSLAYGSDAPGRREVAMVVDQDVEPVRVDRAVAAVDVAAPAPVAPAPAAVSSAAARPSATVVPSPSPSPVRTVAGAEAAPTGATQAAPAAPADLTPADAAASAAPAALPFADPTASPEQVVLEPAASSGGSTGTTLPLIAVVAALVAALVTAVVRRRASAGS